MSIVPVFIVNLTPKGLYESILNSNNKYLDYNWKLVTHVVFAGLVINRFGQAMVSTKTETFSELANGLMFVEWFETLKEKYEHIKVFWSVAERSRKEYGQNVDFWLSLNQVLVHSRADGIYVKMNTKCESYLKACVVPLIIEPYSCEFEMLTYYQDYTSILVINSFGYLFKDDFTDFEKESDLFSTIEMLNQLQSNVNFSKAVLGLDTSMLCYKNTLNGDNYTCLPIYLLSKLLFSGRIFKGQKYKFKRFENQEMGSSTLTLEAPPYFEMITYDSILTRTKKLRLAAMYGFAGIIVGDISNDYNHNHTGSYIRLYEDFVESQEPL